MLLGVVAVVVMGCTSPPPPDVGDPVAASIPAVGSRIDPGWPRFGSPDGNWKVVSRKIGHDRQTLGIRPSDETYEYPNDCLGCNHPSATALLTIYATGAYDPVAVNAGQPVTVNDGEGFFLPPRWPAGAVLAWQYGRNAWVTAHGRSTTTGELDRLLELAAEVRPTERTPVRFPLSLVTLPADMPLSSVDSWGEVNRTTLLFDGRGAGTFEVPVAACATASDRLSVRLLRSDHFTSYRSEAGRRHEVYTIPVQIGGRDGYLHEDRDTEAAIKVGPGLVVVFELSGPFAEDGSKARPPTTRFDDVLGTVVWAPEPADEATWADVADWARS